MAALMVLAARQQIARIGIATGANDIMHRATKGIYPVPLQTILNNRGHRAHRRKTAPHALPGGDMGSMQRTGLTRIEPLLQIIPVPQIQIANLWSLDRSDAKEMTGGGFKTGSIAGTDQNLPGFYSALTRGPIQRKIRHRKRRVGVANHRFDGTARFGICGHVMG